jgi:hypothetical protein
MHAINDAKAAMDSAEARVAADADGSDTQALEDMLNAMATFEAVGGYTQDKTVAEVYTAHTHIHMLLCIYFVLVCTRCTCAAGIALCVSRSGLCTCAVDHSQMTAREHISICQGSNVIAHNAFLLSSPHILTVAVLVLQLESCTVHNTSR